MRIRLAALLIPLLALPQTVYAEWSWRGHTKLQPSYTTYEQGQRIRNDLELRLMFDMRRGPWTAEAHYEVLAAADGEGVTWGDLNDDGHRPLDLAAGYNEGNTNAALHRIDRLTVGYAGKNLVLRLGRQAVSWGNGFVYNPLDVFNPFAPTAVDKDYKTGDDLLYGQWLLSSGADWQLIAAPRRDLTSGDLAIERSSLAFKYHGFAGANDFDLLAARHYGENLLGFGYAATWGESIWRLDATVTRLSTGGEAIAATTNLDYSWVWWGHNVYGFGELHFNSLGQDDIDPLTIDPALLERIARSESFTLGRYYLAGGLQVELTPLLHLAPTLVVNLTDGSFLVPLRLNYDLRQDMSLQAGVNFAFGAKGTEFGGLDMPGSEAFAGSGNTVYARLGYYF